MTSTTSADAIADVDPETLGAYRAAAKFVGAAASLSLLAATTTTPPRSLRRRSAATWSLLCLAGAGAARAFPAPFAHTVRRHSRIVVPGLVVGGSFATLFSGGHRNPVYFSVVTTTAVAGGLVGTREGSRVGAAATAGYGLAVLSTARPWTADGQSVWWNASEAAGLWAAGRAGAQVGDLALSLRSLETARRREHAVLTDISGDETASARLGRSAIEVRDTADNLRRSVLALSSAAERGALAQDSLGPAVQQDLAGLQHLKLAPLLLRAETGEPIDLRAELAATVAELTTDDVEVTLTVDPTVPAVIRARQETVIVYLVKRAIDNATFHAPRRPVHVDIAIRMTSAAELDVIVEDDGGGEAPDQRNFGDGLSASHQDFRELGGDLTVTDGVAGVRLHGELAIEADEDASALIISIADRVEETQTSIMETMRLTTAVQSACQLLDGQTVEHAFQRLMRHLAWCSVGEAAIRTDSKRAVIAAGIGSVLSYRSPGRPANNSWPSILSTELALRGREWLPTATALVSALILTGGVRDSLTRHLGETLTERSFPAVAGLLGDFARRAAEDVVAKEQELVSTIQQLALISELQKPLLSANHDVLEAIHRTPVWPALVQAEREGRLPELAETTEAADALKNAAAELLKDLSVPISPAALLIEQLRVQLWPTPLDVSGEDLLVTVARDETTSWQLARARDRIWMIHLADGLAVALRRSFPVDALGRPRLSRVKLSFEPAGQDVLISVRPIPMQPSRARSSPDAVARLALQLGGRLVEGYEDGLLSLRVRPSAFVS